MDQYTIYLVNQSADTQTFWCFLAPPQELESDPGVFANSSASMSVSPNFPGTNSFVIPAQYVVGAGASNQAVGLNVQVISDITPDANLTDTWDAAYANVPPNQGPTLSMDPAKAGPGQIAITTNNFNQVNNENSGWFGSQSFGIRTEAGFIGMTWSPKPGQTRTLTPALTFYVAIGPFGRNALASWDTISNSAQSVSVPNDFANNVCTVTYTPDGSFNADPGPPSGGG